MMQNSNFALAREDSQAIDERGRDDPIKLMELIGIGHFCVGMYSVYIVNT